MWVVAQLLQREHISLSKRSAIGAERTRKVWDPYMDGDKDTFFKHSLTTHCFRFNWFLVSC